MRNMNKFTSDDDLTSVYFFAWDGEDVFENQLFLVVHDLTH